MGDFNFNAPQYVDFTSPEELELRDYGDEYFDMDHEIKIEYQEVQSNQEEQVHEALNGSVAEQFNPLGEIDMDHEIQVEYYEVQSNHEEQVYETLYGSLPEQPNPLGEVNARNGEQKLRRSVSAGNILVRSIKTEDEAGDLGSKLESLQLSERKPNMNKLRNACIPNTLPSKPKLLGSKSNSNSTTKLNKPLNRRAKAVSRDGINNIGLVKNEKLKRKMSVENLHPNKYISLAEAINKFQHATPLRFHTKSSKVHFDASKPSTSALHCTVPQSPMLSTKTRSRLPNCISHEEQEQMEADEMKKHQIKAQPVNYKILRAPVLNVKVEKKPNTVPEPFRFSQMQFHKPVQQPKEDLYEFHARPAPKTTAAIKVPTRKSVMLPQVQDIFNNKLCIKPVAIQHSGITKKVEIKKLVKTKLEPFSFEQRDRIKQQKKEEKIKKILEEEKKAREFHARPLPRNIASGSGQVESKIAKFLHGDSNSSLNSLKNDENMDPHQVLFKAKPATVIHKKPFKPKKEDRPLLEISEFNLNSDKRAKEREEFDRKMKEKEEEYEKLKQEQMEIRKQQELDEINKIRKETVYKANPVKHYKPLEIHPSTKKITSPISPSITKKRMAHKDL